MPTPTMLSLLAQAEQAGASHGLQTGLLEGLLETESGFNPGATGKNPGGSIDRGIAQINNQAQPQVSDAQAYNPTFAIDWAAQFLASKIRSCGSVVGGLEAYNSGQCQGDTGYASKVLTAAQRYGYSGGVVGLVEQRAPTALSEILGPVAPAFASTGIPTGLLLAAAVLFMLALVAN